MSICRKNHFWIASNPGTCFPHQQRRNEMLLPHNIRISIKRNHKRLYPVTIQKEQTAVLYHGACSRGHKVVCLIPHEKSLFQKSSWKNWPPEFARSIIFHRVMTPFQSKRASSYISNEENFSTAAGCLLATSCSRKRLDRVGVFLKFENTCSSCLSRRSIPPITSSSFWFSLVSRFLLKVHADVFLHMNLDKWMSLRSLLLLPAEFRPFRKIFRLSNLAGRKHQLLEWKVFILEILLESCLISKWPIRIKREPLYCSFRKWKSRTNSTLLLPVSCSAPRQSPTCLVWTMDR